MSEMLRLSDVMVRTIGYLDSLTGNNGMSQLQLNDLATRWRQAFYRGPRALGEITDKDEISRHAWLRLLHQGGGKWRKLDVRAISPAAKAQGRSAETRTRSIKSA